MESIKTVELFDVSISCTRKDREIYQKIKTALESKNITVYHKSKLPENAENTIDCMLRLSRVMILVLSEHVVKDENAKRNACRLCQIARGYLYGSCGTIVIPFRVGDDAVEDLEIGFYLQTVSMFGVGGILEETDIDDAVNRLVDHIQLILHITDTLEYNKGIAERLLWTKKYKQARYYLEKNVSYCGEMCRKYWEMVVDIDQLMTEYMRLISLLIDMEEYSEALERFSEVLDAGYDNYWDENGVLPEQFAFCCVHLNMDEADVIGWLCDNIFHLRGHTMVTSPQIRKYNQSRIDLLLESFREIKQLVNTKGECEIFISYKSEDEQLARMIFQFLQERGKNVFFAKESLPKLGKSDYEDAIFKALGRAKHMVLVASDAEYLNTAWVKDEWSTFNNEIREGRKEGNIVLLLEDKVVENKGAIPLQLRQKEIVLKSEMKTKLLSYLR